MLRCCYQRTTRQITEGGGVDAEKIKQTRPYVAHLPREFVVGVVVMKQRARLIVLWFTVQ